MISSQKSLTTNQRYDSSSSRENKKWQMDDNELESFKIKDSIRQLKLENASLLERINKLESQSGNHSLKLDEISATMHEIRINQKMVKVYHKSDL